MDERSRRVERAFEWPILIAALLVIPVVAIEQSDLGDPWRFLAAVANWVIWIAFATELIVMLVVVPDKWEWLRRHPLEVAVVVLTPPFLPAALQAARVLRLLRLLRLLRVAPLARRLFSLDGLRYVALLVALAALGGGATYAAVEDVSTWDGVWWAVSTMTTVGYGDEFPVTVLGRLIAMALMVIGIGFIAVLTGAVAERFLATTIEASEAQVTEEVDQAEADVLDELREIMLRLHSLERRLGQRIG
ncbi:MAG: two pore domain potassium channel family protein [Actinobacteria bacterium]|nr:two pore domain potassium channel family protein [Actinomycetota bacterium]